MEKKLDNLLDAKLERSISTSEYLSKKDTLVNEKVRIEDKFAQLRGEGLVWLEPMREFILLSKQAKKVAISRDLLEIKNSMKNICSNFLLKGKTLRFEAPFGLGCGGAKRLIFWVVRPEGVEPPTPWSEAMYSIH